MAVLQQVSEGAEVHVPHVWPLEVTNALVKAFRRNHLTREELFEYAQQLGGLRIKGSEREFVRRWHFTRLPSCCKLRCIRGWSRPSAWPSAGDTAGSDSHDHD